MPAARHARRKIFLLNAGAFLGVEPDTATMTLSVFNILIVLMASFIVIFAAYVYVDDDRLV